MQTSIHFQNRFRYDANGNIVTQVRRGPASGISLDSLTYHYTSGTNQLAYVTDAVSAGNYSDDIDNQSSGNYDYDEIGNLVGDAQEEIDSIAWTVYGKVKSITRTGGSLKPDLEFEYSPDGQRVAKIIKPKTGEHLWKYTYYVRDAQGNIMATYARNLEAIFDPEETNFADVNAALVSEGGAAAFKNYIQNLHQEITSGGFIDSLKAAYLAEHLYDIDYIYLFDPTGILVDNGSLYTDVFNAFTATELAGGLFGTVGVADVYGQMCTYDAIGFIEHGITHISATTYLNGLYSYDPAQLLQMYTDAGGTGTPGAAAQITYIIGAWSNSAIASWINGVGCSLNYSVLAALYAPGNSNWTTILTSYPNFKTAVTAQYSQADIIAALISYNRNYVWDIMYDNSGGSNTYLVGWLFDNNTTEAYTKMVQYFPEFVDEVQDAHPYYTLTQYFEHIKDIYGQTMHDRMVYLFIHLSNQFTDRFAATEWHLYGSSRLGVQRPGCGESAVCAGHCAAPDGRELIRVEFEGTWEEYAAAFSDTAFSDTSNTQISIFEMNYQYYTLMRGQKSYEMSNHLGNVLAIVSDKRIMTCANDTVNYFTADLLQATDYSAFGVQLKERTWYGDTTLKGRHGFGGQEQDNEISGDGRNYTAEFWEYSSDLGRRWNRDPIVKSWESPYATFSDNPIVLTDPFGLDAGGDPPDKKSTSTPLPSGDAWETHNEEGYTGKQAGAFNLPEARVAASKPQQQPTKNFFGRIMTMFNRINNWLKDAEIKTTGTFKVSAGAQIGVEGRAYGLKVGAKANVISANLYTGITDGKSWSHDYAGKDGSTLISHGIGASAELPTKSKWELGGSGTYQYRLDGEFRDHDNESDYSISLVRPILRSPKAEAIKNKMEQVGLSGMGKPPKVESGVAKEKDFYGIDAGGAAALILGIDVSIKVGIEK